MLTFSLQSGSNGNSIYVEACDVRLLFDAGISGSTAEARMAVHGREIRDVDALIISHEHVDHVSAAGIFHRKFRIPIYMTRATRNAIDCPLGPLSDVRFFQSGQTLSFGPVQVHTLPTAHDAVDGVAFIIEAEGKRLGILTDLGHPFLGLMSALESTDAAYLESNYDPYLLETGGYPDRLKARIRGDKGHLSNEEAAWVVRSTGRRRPVWIAVAHLSAENNRPELAINAQYQVVGRDYPIYHAPRYQVSPVLEV